MTVRFLFHVSYLFLKCLLYSLPRVKGDPATQSVMGSPAPQFIFDQFKEFWTSAVRLILASRTLLGGDFVR
ncbi:unnamed protein product [Citrullus colocynthis]|uniref:Secreted protein n=1 Tax=Citrullus colocynthis TaxID=252529 RepID=A0ABP0YRG1_9ROSI